MQKIFECTKMYLSLSSYIGGIWGDLFLKEFFIPRIELNQESTISQLNVQNPQCVNWWLNIPNSRWWALKNHPPPPIPCHHVPVLKQVRWNVTIFVIKKKTSKYNYEYNNNNNNNNKLKNCHPVFFFISNLPSPFLFSHQWRPKKKDNSTHISPNRLPSACGNPFMRKICIML